MLALVRKAREARAVEIRAQQALERKEARGHALDPSPARRAALAGQVADKRAGAAMPALTARGSVAPLVKRERAKGPTKPHTRDAVWVDGSDERWAEMIVQAIARQLTGQLARAVAEAEDGRARARAVTMRAAQERRDAQERTHAARMAAPVDVQALRRERALELARMQVQAEKRARGA
jgi:hypothetical protein